MIQLIGFACTPAKGHGQGAKPYNALQVRCAPPRSAPLPAPAARPAYASAAANCSAVLKGRFAGLRAAATGAISQLCRSADMRFLQLAGKHLVIKEFMGTELTPFIIYSGLLRISKTFKVRARVRIAPR